GGWVRSALEAAAGGPYGWPSIRWCAQVARRDLLWVPLISTAHSSYSMTAYLVIREGSKWTDVFRLVDGESITVGRAPTNAIVVKDERCSRNHAEVFQSQGQWMLRDLDSRNGTLVDGQRIQHDYHLQPGEIIRIGNSHLAFVHDLSQAFPVLNSVLRT